MSKTLGGEPIHKIMMSDTNGEKAFDILDDETIKSLIEAPSEVELKKADGLQEPMYNLYVYTDEYEVYGINVNEDMLYFGGNFYSVIGENIFYQTVNEIYKQQN